LPHKTTGTKIIALDMSANSFAVSSEESQFVNPHFYRRAEPKMSKLSRKHSNKQKGSKNKEKARLRLAKCNLKISNQRKDWLHKVSTKLVRDFDIIGVEDLDIKEMQQGNLKGLSKTISQDFCWSEFVRMLEYKSEWNGKYLIKVDRYFPSSQLCSCCGYQNKGLTLSDREWICPHCGQRHDRDKNAALNIKKEALRLLNTAGAAEVSSNLENMPLETAAGC
jgi:putative transposase